MIKQIFGLMTLLIFSFSFPIFTSAHSHMIESNPSENEILHSLPATVSVTFNTPIQAAFYSLEVYNEAGSRIDADKSVIKENRLENKLPDKIENGTYTLKWKIVSNDGHPSEGSLSFQMEMELPKKDILSKEEKSSEEQKVPVIEERQTTNKPTANVSLKDDISMWKTVDQYMLYLSLSVYVGILFFYSKLLPKDYPSPMNRSSQQSLWLAVVGLTLSVLLSLPLQVLNISETLSLSSFRTVLSSTNFGIAWTIEIILLILLLFTTYLGATKVKFFTITSFILLASLMLAKSFIGHTMIASIQVAAVALNFFHLLAMSLWLGGLFSILFLLPSATKNSPLPEQRTVYWQVLTSFSSWSILFVSVLLASGVLNSLLHLVSVSALLSTHYGQVLLAKVVLMLIMILFGTYHFFQIKQQKRAIQSSVWIELSLGFIVLILAAILTYLPTA